MIMTAEEFVTLRASERQEDYLRASTDRASTTTWFEVIDKFPEMRAWVAQNKTVPSEVLAKLANDSDPKVRVAVAMKNKLSQELIALLANDAEENVRERIAYRKKTPIAILTRLATDNSGAVSAPARRRIERET